jgi:DNA-binding MarR family transcriptional regulator
MAAPIKFISVLDNQPVLEAFKLVASMRRIQLKDLASRLKTTTEDASTRVKQLKDVNLIEEQPSTSSMEDFKTYYVTSDGLSFERQLREWKKE